MPSALPRTDAEFVQAVTQLAPQWRAHAEAIGIGQEVADEFADAAARAAAAYAEALRARDAAQRAVATARAAMLDARRQGGRIMSMVRLVAERHAEPSTILNLAGIASARRPSAPNLDSARLTPRAPTQVRATLLPQTGAIELTFKARQPASLGNVTYRVQRAVVSSAARLAGHAASGHDAPGTQWEDIGFAGINPHTAPGSAADCNARGDTLRDARGDARGDASGDGLGDASGVAGTHTGSGAGSGRKQFIDPAPRPAADGTIRYRLIAQCGWRSSGPSATLIVQVPVGVGVGVGAVGVGVGVGVGGRAA